MKKICLGVIFLCLLVASPVFAATTIGGITFADNAFADSVLSQSGSFSTSGGSVSSVLTDIDAGTFAFSWSPGAYVQLGFTDNKLVNGAGADLALFETGVPDYFNVSLTIGGNTILYQSASDGYSYGSYASNVALINLDDFGVAPGAKLSSIVVGLDYDNGGTVPSLSLVGAINSCDVNGVPEPATMLLLGLGLAGLAVGRKFKN